MANLLFVMALFLELFTLPSTVSAQQALNRYASAEYILYKGKLTGQYEHPPDMVARNCPNYSIGPFDGAALYVGKYPSWDLNPYFFELYLYGSSSRNMPSPKPAWVEKLSFKTTGLLCYKDGQRCASVVLWPWEDIPFRLLDLTNEEGHAVTERVTVGSSMGYKVQGNEKSFLGDGTLRNMVEVHHFLNLTDNPMPVWCMKQQTFEWYALQFLIHSDY
jgi:hypothetical protein